MYSPELTASRQPYVKHPTRASTTAIVSPRSGSIDSDGPRRSRDAVKGAQRRIRQHWSRDGLGPAILDALIAAGKDLKALTIDDLAPLDQFHGGGKPGTVRLARLAALQPDSR